ncbi:DNA polymerase III subunit gamma and tau [Rothia mucilaginosa]|uniref:DNA-directed DNA polymerase n=1 Tax=Rothia mucilaginosa TaxID=43675 RepID=A0A943TDB7_9MICC|nr:DNA polymerase III subunit gamma and tau [Rothia mucilaginosa]MBS6634903.1 DNA polymerase III subunit gamma and tau [Rothia mucilaginosa]
MSTALYRRYRPETFAEVIGQEQVTVPLMTALEKNRVNHAYLFSGPRGCGKTTSARILARCLNCAQGPTPTPCGVCDSCRELSRDGGGSLDVIEMDAASHGGVDHARDLRERATLAPVRDRYKIFIIDEAHMVTREGFNALLKIVEEPPEHVKFIFATTEPNKVLGTIRSRTHHYPFRLVPPEVLLPYLQSLCDQEQVAVEPGVLQLVIRAGGGSVRDSLSILDQLMAGASSEKGIEYDLAVALLGYTHAQLLDEVVEALGAKEASTLFGAVSRVVATGQDPRRFVEDLLERLRDLIVVKAVPQSAAQILQGVPQDQLDRLAVQAQALSERELTLAAGTVNDALNGMTGASNPQLQLELLCARLLLPVAEGSANGAEIAALASRLQVLERRVTSGVAGSAPASVQAGSQAPAGMSAARAAGMAAAGLAPKTQAPNTQVLNASSAPVQEAIAQQAGSQQAGAGAPPLAGAPLSSAPLAPVAQAPAAQETASQAPATQTLAPLASPAQAGAPLTGTAPVAAPNASAPAASAPVATTPPAPLKLNPNDPLAAVQGNWRAILNRMSVPGSAEQLAQVYPARVEGTVLYVRADIATLRAVKGYVPELTARVSEFLRGPVTIHAEVVKPGEPLKPGAPTPQQEAQPVAPAPQQPAAPLAEGPRGGEDAWRRHGQPVNDAAAPASTSVDAPLGAWDVAPIPQSEETAPADPSPAEPFPAQVPPVQPAPSSPAGPLSQPGPDAPVGGFGERDSFAASGSGVPHEAPGRSDALEPPFEDEPPYAEPVYAEPPEVAAPSEAPTEERAAHLAPAGPLARPAVPETVAPETPAVTPAAEPVAPAGPLAGGPLTAGPLAAGPLAPAPANESVAEPVPPTEPASSEVVPAKPVHVVTEEDYISEDDEKVENSTFIGLRAIEKIIGGTVIDERPLHQG